ncbi:MarR family transcriptional regulator [Archaeoglobus sp.]
MDLEDAVLLAIAKGLNDLKRIAKKLNVRMEDVKYAIDGLEAKGLIARKTKGLIFKKEVYELTKEGFERVERIKEELEKVADEFKTAYESGDRERLKMLYQDYYYFIPLMVTFGLLDLIWLSTLLSDFDMFGDLGDTELEDIDADFDFDVEF